MRKYQKFLKSRVRMEVWKEYAGMIEEAIFSSSAFGFKFILFTALIICAFRN